MFSKALGRPRRGLASLITVAAAIAAIAVAGCGSTGGPSGGGNATTAKKGGSYTVGMLPKTTADPYFVAAHQGAEQAAKALGMKLIFNGPSSLDVAGQNQIISQWAQKHVSAITVSANDPNALVPALKQAISQGIDVSSWDADVNQSARKFFMSQPTPDQLATTLVEQMVSSVGPSAKILLMTSTLTAPNQNLWVKAIKQYVGQKYPKLVIQKVLPGEADTSKSFNVAKAWLQAHPETKGVLTVDGAELAGAAQAVEALNKKGKVVLTGIGVPSQNGKDVKSGTVKSAVLWNPVDIGYATMYMVHDLLTGKLKPGATELDAGRLGKLKVDGTRIILGTPLVFTKQNVDQFKF